LKLLYSKVTGDGVVGQAYKETNVVLSN